MLSKSIDDVAEFEPVAPVKKSISYVSQNTANRVKSNDEIRGLLNKLLKHHTLLSVTLDGSEKVFGSVILDINIEDKYLVLDELYPREEFKSSLKGVTLFIETRHEGILIRFSTKVLAISEDHGSEYYKTQIPAYLHYHQKRADYRVPISIANPLPADMSTENDVLLHAELRDLSLGGLSAKLTTPPSEKLEIGEEIPTCIIQLPNGYKIISSLEIIRIDETKPFRNTKIGARFINLSSADQQVLAHMIAQLDRSNIKNLKRINDT